MLKEDAAPAKNHTSLPPDTLKPLRQCVGIIDLGSNSARLILVRYTPGLAYQITDQLSRRVRLSEGMAEDNVLRPAAMGRALEVIQMFRTFCDVGRVRRILPVATAAVRNATNGVEFLDRVRQETGFKFRLLSGEEEAYFGALGVINSLGLREGLVMDVGGGSAEVSEIRAGRFKRGVTSPLGAVRLTELYLDGSDPVRPAAVARLKAHIASTFDPLTWMKIEPGMSFVGLGGTVRALVRIDRALAGYPLGLTHGYELKRDRLEKVILQLRRLPVKQRAQKIPGLQPERADILLAGALVVVGAMHRAGAERLWVSGQGLREGLFYREFLKPADSPRILDVRAFSVLNLARLFRQEKAHADQVAYLALALFDQLSALHGYGPVERGWLWAACQLHDIGATLDYYDHHKHAAYIIVNTGLAGYSHRETALIALLCLYHHKGRPALEPYADLCESRDLERLNRLAALIRLAENLDRTQSQIVTGLKAHLHGRQVGVRLRTRGDARVEVWEAQRNADLFEKAFGCTLDIR